MLLYNGSRYVKGNVFLDSRGNKLTFDKNTLTPFSLRKIKYLLLKKELEFV